MPKLLLLYAMNNFTYCNCEWCIRAFDVIVLTTNLIADSKKYRLSSWVFKNKIVHGSPKCN